MNRKQAGRLAIMAFLAGGLALVGARGLAAHDVTKTTLGGWGLALCGGWVIAYLYTLE